MMIRPMAWLLAWSLAGAGLARLGGALAAAAAALAVAAARALAPVSDAEVRLGLERLRWPGRFEIVRTRPPVVLDGAHNGASAAALAETLTAYARERPILLVMGINRDKDARAVLRPLLPLAERVWATQAAGNPRALNAAELAGICLRLGAHAEAAASVQDALRAAIAGARQGVVCVTGSLMLVGQARAALGLPAPLDLW
jgi:dihydrofolate synthase/folylpolyglutamate synthase